MSLDFTKLNNLARGGFTDQTDAKTAHKTPQNGLLDEEARNGTENSENAPESQIERQDGTRQLQLQADANRAEKEQAIAVFREYQENTKRSSRLQIEILKGVKRGENIYPLFLKAVEAISLMTSTKVFYTQIKGDIKAVYGAGLLEPPALEVELKEVQERLEKLTEAQKRGTEPAESQQRIQEAIKAHKQREEALQTFIKEHERERA